jgi:hypothetical protein
MPDVRMQSIAVERRPAERFGKCFGLIERKSGSGGDEEEVVGDRRQAMVEGIGSGRHRAVVRLHAGRGIAL